MGEIAEKIGMPAVLEQLAEESSELAQAALKLARILRRENPTPVSYQEAIEHLREEVADVNVCTFELYDICGLANTVDIEADKYTRWCERIGLL